MDSLTKLASSTTNGPLNEAIGLVGSSLALIVLTAIIFFLAMRSGRAMLVSLILSLYVGFAIYSFFPFTDALKRAAGTSATSEALAGLVLFGILTGSSFVLIRRVAGSGYATIRALPLFILALLTGGFLLALGYHSLHVSDVYPLTSTLKSLFAPDRYFFWWFVAPLAGLFFLAR